MWQVLYCSDVIVCLGGVITEGECKLFDLLSILSRPCRSSAVGKLVSIDDLGHPEKVEL